MGNVESVVYAFPQMFLLVLLEHAERDNTVEDCKGWGVRLGGWSLYGTQYGVNNSVRLRNE